MNASRPNPFSKPLRDLRRSAYFCAPLLAVLGVAACSSSQIDGSASGEAVSHVSDAVQLTGITATASSVNGSNTAANAVDGNTGTRWESVNGTSADPSWITLDLGSQKAFDRVYLSWEGAYASSFKVQQSNDNVTFTDLYSTTTGTGGINDLTGLAGNARYVRMYATVRGTPYGYSLWEMQVHQTATSCLSNNLTTSATLPMTASAVNGGNTAALGHDNNTGSRWESPAADPQWLQIDLGSKEKINRVNIQWETASAKDYTVQVSDDGVTFTTLVTKTGMPAATNRIDDLTGLNGAGRYVRVNGTARTTGYGYSIFELNVYGDPNPNCGGSSCTPTTCAALSATCGTPSDGCGGTLTCGTCATGSTCNASNQCVVTNTDSCGGTCALGQNCVSNACVAATAGYYNSGKTLDATPDFGANVKVYTPATALTTVRDDISAIYQVQRTNQFGPARNAVLFTPGTYNVLPINCAETDQTTATNLIVTATSGTPSAAFDNNTGTLWQSAAADPQTLQVDMGAIKRITRVNISWEVANAKDYTIQVSSDGTGWTTVATQTGMAAGTRTDDIVLATPTRGRYVKMVGTARTNTAYGYSIWEMNVYGDHNASCDLGAPLPIGFNTEFAGLGDHPDAVDLNGRIIAPPDFLPANNGTQTFWRALTNFKSSYVVNGANHMWAVSQAAPMRRVHTVGSVDLHLNYGWESGGYIADSSIDGFLLIGSQQQFYTRNSFIGTADSGSWNITFQGSTGTRATNEALFPAGPRTEIANSPVVREKPFLFVNRDGHWNVFAPAVRTNAVGPSWTGTQAGTSIPLTSFYIAKSATDTATTMNAALASGKHLLITPGVYHLSAPLAVNNANTVVLGMGMATLVPDGGVNAINVADVDGVKIAGLILDAGTTSSAVLLRVGPVGSTASHAANPTSIHDIFSRIGGGTWIGKAAISIQINSKDAISDHIWLWRADHSDTANVTGWSVNTATNGLVVNGANVSAYGNFVEHFQQYEVLWNGENGKLWFLQNEHPYDAPSQAAYMNGTTKGWAAYKVADTVTTHLGTAVSSYAVFTMNACTTNTDCDQTQGYTNVCATDGFCTPPPALMQGDRVIEANAAQANVKFDNMVSLSLTSKGKLNNMVNSDGLAANAVDFSTYPKLDAWH